MSTRLAMTAAAVGGVTLLVGAQPVDQHGDGDSDALRLRVAALEARVAVLERREREQPGRPTQPPTGKLNGMPRPVVDSIAWAHPGANVTKTRKDEDLYAPTIWEIELLARGVSWKMNIRANGEILDDRVAE